jgi:hypothetical protein
MEPAEFQPLAVVEVDAVRPERQGFTLTGRGPDHAEYQLDLQFGMPLDPRTRAVLGELLSHSELVISRRSPATALSAALRARRQNP